MADAVNCAYQILASFPFSTTKLTHALAGVCSVVGLGRAVVLQPSLPREILLNPAIPDDEALATPHIVKGLWVTRLGVLPKLVGMGLPLQFFYYNMRRLGSGLNADPHTSVSPSIATARSFELTAFFAAGVSRLVAHVRSVQGQVPFPPVLAQVEEE